jgi:hypothetical protein
VVLLLKGACSNSKEFDSMKAVSDSNHKPRSVSLFGFVGDGLKVLLFRTHLKWDSSYRQISGDSLAADQRHRDPTGTKAMTLCVLRSLGDSVDRRDDFRPGNA